MKQLVIAVLLAAAISLGYRLVGTFAVIAGDAPPPPRETPKTPEPKSPIQPAAVRVDRTALGRNLARSDIKGPDSSRRGNELSKRSSAVPRSTAKPVFGAPTIEFAAARTSPPVAPPGPRMIGPDGIVFQKVGITTLAVSSARQTPSLIQEEPIVQTPLPAQQPLVRIDMPLSPEPSTTAQPIVTPARGKMIGPDGIEFHAVQRGN